MPVRVVEAPQPFVTIDDARRHIVDLPPEDEAYVEMLILAATTWIDGPTGWLGRTLGVQTLELTTDGFFGINCDAGAIPLPFPPVIEVESVVYTAPNGQVITLPDDRYVSDIGGISPAGGSWPATAPRKDAVKITYKAGEPQVPAPIKVAILMLVAGWYRTREAVSIGAEPYNLPFTVESLLQPYRIYR